MCIRDRYMGAQFKTSQNSLEQVPWSRFPEEWPMQDFEIYINDDSDNISEVVEKLKELNAPYTRSRIIANWAVSQDPRNTKLKGVLDLLAKIETLAYLEFNFASSRVSDEGFASLAQLLKSTTKIISLHFSIPSMKFNDKGILCLSSEFPYLYLQELSLGLQNTLVTDRGIISLAESLPQSTSQLRYLSIELDETNVSDFGVIALADALSTLPLRKLILSLTECRTVTDRSSKNLSEMIVSCKMLIHISLFLRRTRMTQNGIKKISEQKTAKHQTFGVFFWET
eukprot:TRINITY_DN5370_c0_g3_i1.p1 TRINITY_DN5370_c0_g3~~TRINITY_DN5370_c0_g3_i1.p1  ORF type:complete len:283 (-),score=39.11 TRINITY_DN5370_c0_g3_i1:9-857(-)